MNRDTELAMLEVSVMPKIQKAKECMRAGKTEEMREIISHDLVELFCSYRDSEMEKYDNAPNNLKGSHNVERMLKDAELYQNAIDLLWDEKEDEPRSVDEETLGMVERIANDIIGTK